MAVAFVFPGQGSQAVGMGKTLAANFAAAQQVFEEAYADAPDEAARYRLAQQVKKLTLPDQMGERFQAMVLARGMDMVPLPADMLEADQGDRL